MQEIPVLEIYNYKRCFTCTTNSVFPLNLFCKLLKHLGPFIKTKSKS